MAKNILRKELIESIIKHNPYIRKEILMSLTLEALTIIHVQITIEQSREKKADSVKEIMSRFQHKGYNPN